MKVRRKRDHTHLAAVAPLNKRTIHNLESVIPRSEILQVLAKMQVPFPASLPEIKQDDAFPSDVTRLGPRDLRALQSYWTAQYARVNALLGIAASERKIAERKLEREKLRRFAIRSNMPRNSKALKDTILGEIQKSKNIARMEAELDSLIRLEMSLEALVKDFQAYCNSLDREMMFRMSEMRLNSKGGNL